MKRFLFLCFACLVSLNSFSISESGSSFKKGDWFECEMEFEGDLPVFRNHWIPDKDSLKRKTDYIQIRYTYVGENEKQENEWEYEILRFKQIHYTLIPGMENNFSVFDSWYPDVEGDTVEKLKKLKGKISIKENSLFITADYVPTETFSAKTVLHVKRNNHYIRSSFKVSSTSIYKTVNNISNLIFLKESADLEGSTFHYKTQFKKVDSTKPNSRTLYFRQLVKQKNGDVQYKTFKWVDVELLPNHLPFKMKGRYGHDVFVINKASFDIPNEASITFIDHRKLKDNKYIRMAINNPSQVISQTGNEKVIQLENNSYVKKYHLKCGVGITIQPSDGKWVSFFLEPGDNITVTIRAEDIELGGNKNSEWLDSISLKRVDSSNILNGEISAEFKSFLLLGKRMNNTHKNLEKFQTSNELSKSLLPYYYLKSYHYNTGLSFPHFHPLIRSFSMFRENFIRSAGVSFSYGFETHFSQVTTHYDNYFLYTKLRDILVGQFSFYRSINSPEYYSLYLSKCGDPYLCKEVKKAVDNRKALLPGKICPIKSLMTDEGEEINIVPKKNNYSLIYLNVRKYQSGMISLIDKKLPSNVNCYTYHYTRPSKNEQTAKEYDNLIKLYGHSSFITKLDQFIPTASSAIALLLNSKGEILYCDIP